MEFTRALYHAELEAVDFICAAEASRGKMNSWIEKQTSGKEKAHAWLPGQGASGVSRKSLTGV